jgi:hypothetical protein
MKRSYLPLKLAFLLSLVLLIAFNAGPFVQNLEETRDKKTFLKAMREATKTRKYSSTTSIYQESAIISDISFVAKDVIDISMSLDSKLNGASAARIQVPLTRNDKIISLKLIDIDDPQISFKIFDQYQKLIATCSGAECNSLDFRIGGNSAVFLIQAKNIKNSTGRVILKRLSDFELLEIPYEIPTIELNLSALSLQQLNHLVSTANVRTKVGSMNIPSQKILGVMKCCGSTDQAIADVQVGLSGRSGGHFGVFPPSLSVSIVSGNPLFGALKFKLIRPEMRHGLSEMVLSSIMKDFGLPVQSLNLVVLKLNGQIAGLHYFEEAVSSTFFENNKLNEGYIFGYSRDKFFKPETPFLEEKILFSPPSRSKFRNVKFTSEKFFKKVDKHQLTLISSFLAFFTGTHGLGADDLNFYEDPISGVMRPFARDYKVGAWSILDAGNNRALNSHLSFLTMSTPPSVAAIFGDLSTDRGYDTESLGVWDIHPSLKKLMSSFEHRVLFEKHFLDIVENDFLNLFEARLKRAGEVVLSSKIYNIPSVYKLIRANHSYLQNEFNGIQNNKNFSIGPLISDSLEKRKPLVFEENGRLFILNSLPFSLKINATSPNCRVVSGNTFVGPLRGVSELKPITPKVAEIIRDYDTSMKRLNNSNYYSPLCELDILATKIHSLEVELPNGTKIQPAFLNKKYEEWIPEEITSKKFLNDHKEILNSYEERAFIFSTGNDIKISDSKFRIISHELVSEQMSDFTDEEKLNLHTKGGETSALNIKIHGVGYETIAINTRIDLNLLAKSLNEDKKIPDNSSILSIVYEGLEAKVEMFGFNGLAGGAIPTKHFNFSKKQGLSEIQLTLQKQEAVLSVDGVIVNSWKPGSTGGPDMIRIGDYNAATGLNSHMKLDYIGVGVKTTNGKFFDKNQQELLNKFDNYVALVPHNYIDNRDHVILSYAMHMTDNLSWNRKNLIVRSQSLKGVTPPLSKPYEAVEINVERNQFPRSNIEFFNSYMDNSYNLFSQNSVIFNFKIKKTSENQYFQINKKDILELVKYNDLPRSDNANPNPYALIIDSKSHKFANFIPAMDISSIGSQKTDPMLVATSSNSNKKVVKALAKMETILANLKNDILVALPSERSREYGQKFCFNSKSYANSGGYKSGSNDKTINQKIEIILQQLPYNQLLQKVKKYQNSNSEKIRIIDTPIQVKSGEVLRIEGGEIWLFGENASLEVKGTLIIDGDRNNPVILGPLEGKWPGLIINGSNSKNIINHSFLFGVKASPGRFGAISLEHSSLRIRNSILLDLSGADGLNVHKSDFYVSNSILGVAKSDIIDTDFSSGEVSNSIFFKSNGDYIDLNQSNFVIKGNVLINSFVGFGLGDPDKGISCGEKSFCNIKNNYFQNLTFGVAIKDGSFSNVSRNYFHSNMLGIAQFVKKSWFGKPNVKLNENNYYNNCENTADLGELRY